jgi:predicted ATP-binding protein involved in virulence
MEEIFVSEINVKDTRCVKNLSIPFSDSQRKHLIITGKNGCGKTSLLLELNTYLNNLLNGQRQQRRDNIKMLEFFKTQLTKELSKLESAPSDSNINQKIAKLRLNIKQRENWFKNFGGSQINFKNEHLLWEKVNKGTFIIIFFESERHTNMKVPSGINKINLQQRYNPRAKVNQDFIQYIVNLKADRSFARDDGENNIVASIDKWFDSFQESLKKIFESPDLELKFDRKNYNFQIMEKDKEPYGFNTLSDGYSAIISIVTELLLRMEAHKVKNYDMEGLVLIDEIETHLHVELQKKILPFLTDFFPKIQFIVSTHSPFVLSSVSNSVICDLESRLVTSDLSGYSYDALIESYFYSDKYSNLIKDKICKYEALSSKNRLNPEDKQKLRELEEYFSDIPKYLSKELLVKLQEINLKSLSAKRS